jgi:competence protein ComFC
VDIFGKSGKPLLLKYKIMKETALHRLFGAFQVGRPLVKSIRRGIRNAVDFVFPPICLLCNARSDEDGRFCPSCRKRIMEIGRVVHHRQPGDFIHLSGARHFDGVYSCWEFNPEMEQLIHWMKYSQMKRLARFFGETAGGMLESCLGGVPFQMMLPVPLHKVRQRERGYNQSERIGAGLSRVLKIPMRTDVLFRRCNTRTQTDLRAEERQSNVQDAFGVRSPERIQGMSILVVDDVVTTGSTMNSCAKALKDAGVKRVTGFALARPQIHVKFA